MGNDLEALIQKYAPKKDTNGLFLEWCKGRSDFIAILKSLPKNRLINLALQKQLECEGLKLNYHQLGENFNALLKLEASQRYMKELESGKQKKDNKKKLAEWRDKENEEKKVKATRESARIDSAFDKLGLRGSDIIEMSNKEITNTLFGDGKLFGSNAYTYETLFRKVARKMAKRRK